MLTRPGTILLAEGTTIVDFTVDTVFAALHVPTKVLPLAACSPPAIIPMRMETGDTSTIVADLARDGGCCFTDFLCDLTKRQSCVDACFYGGSV